MNSRHSFTEPLPKVSVIMPVFNEEKTVAMAVDSAALQHTDFDIEILVIDDCSTDGTPQVLEKLGATYPNVRIFRNERNSGKGFSFKRGYEAARGEYFHVLDGDDCFVCYDKLQRQVEFLDTHREYFAIGHNTFVMSPQGAGLVAPGLSERDWSNEQCLAGNVYCHTSSILYRRLHDTLPDYFLEEEFRGDSAIFFYTAFTSKLKFKYVPNVWSVYNFHGGGIWSRLKSEEQKEFNLRIVQAFKDKVVGSPGSLADALLEKRLEKVRQAKPSGDRFLKTSIEDFLVFAERASSKVFVHRDEAFKGMYAFRLVDELCEAVGRALCLKAGIAASDRSTDPERAVILVSGLVPGGGGVFREIKELTRILLDAGVSVDLVSTHKIPTEEAIFAEHFDMPGVTCWQADAEDTRSDRLERVIARVAETNAGLMFPFITHNDPVGSAAIQRPMGAKVIFDFVYDHGLSLAVLNSSIDTVVVKTVSQARALVPMMPRAEFSLVPPFFTDRFGPRDFVPFRNGSLTTASAAARSYKVEGGYVYEYAKIVPAVLEASGGTHIHFGPLSDEMIAAIRSELSEKGIDPDRFRHIPWSDDFGGSLIEENVDLFIAPFPICSARIAIEVMACSIPSVSHLLAKPGIPQGIDFIDPQQFVWRKPEDLLELVGGLTENSLRERSASARAYFEANNLIEVAASKLFALQPLVLPRLDKPDFVMSEFSECFEVEVQTMILGAQVVRLGPVAAPTTTAAPFDNVAGAAPVRWDKFWHRTKFRRKLRDRYHVLRRSLRGAAHATKGEP